VPLKNRRSGKPSKLAQSLSLTTADESEIADAFALFLSAEASDEAGEDAIPSSDVRKALKALGLGPSSAEEMEEILEAVDPDDLGYVVRKRFFEVAALKMEYRDTTEEVEAAFKLFTGGADGPIKLEDLRRIAKELKEEVTEEQLRDMIGEATSKDIRKGVDLKDFEGVMKRAGAF